MPSTQTNHESNSACSHRNIYITKLSHGLLSVSVPTSLVRPLCFVTQNKMRTLEGEHKRGTYTGAQIENMIIYSLAQEHTSSGREIKRVTHPFMAWFKSHSLPYGILLPFYITKRSMLLLTLAIVFRLRYWYRRVATSETAGGSRGHRERWTVYAIKCEIPTSIALLGNVDDFTME